MSSPHSWHRVTALGADLPEWAQFMLDLGRHSGMEYSQFPQHKVWRLVTVPHRGMASAMFALGFMEATTPLVISATTSIDLTNLRPGQAITWRRLDTEVACGTFDGYETNETGELMICYRNEKSTLTKRSLAKAKEWQMSPYYGPFFKFPRPMSNNVEFFKAFYPTSHFDLLCHTFYNLCLVGRPALWEDLRAAEITIGGASGSVDDVLRVGGDSENPAGDVSHYLTKFLSPDRDELEPFAAHCCVYDGSHSYPKFKNFIEAPQNLILLDRWESGSVGSVNAYMADYQHAGVSTVESPKGVIVPSTLEYSEWRLART